ncbi:hypothetical protein AB0B79_39400 [Streptomyces sp. NPDC039022]|uniref:hypothetical protein n=1 Tax=Streptomyces sp. NPDC039022 TaxID=3157091 RepID=UPI0033F2A6FA
MRKANGMGVIDPQWIPALREDGRYRRLLNLVQRLAEEREREREGAVPICGSCQGGQVTVQEADGTKHTVQCERCDGTGTVPELADNEDNGEAAGGR